MHIQPFCNLVFVFKHEFIIYVSDQNILKTECIKTPAISYN